MCSLKTGLLALAVVSNVAAVAGRDLTHRSSMRANTADLADDIKAAQEKEAEKKKKEAEFIASIEASVNQKIVEEEEEDGPKKLHTYTTNADDVLPYPSSDYLGMGYNVYQGNPEGDPLLQIDPGFRAPVVVSSKCLA